jgi:hypothetical protein
MAGMKHSGVFCLAGIYICTYIRVVDVVGSDVIEGSSLT